MSIKKILFIFSLCVLIISSGVFFDYSSGFSKKHFYIPTVSADDNEDEQEYEEDEDEDEYRSTSTSSNSSSGNTSVKTNVDTQITVFKDSDGDGLLNKDDPHPDMAEIYIVKDDNRNGIVDNFE